MKRVIHCLVPFISILAVSCQDVLPYPREYQADTLATRVFPFAIFEVEGMLIDSTLENPPVDSVAVQLRAEESVLSHENGTFSTQTIAFPTSQEFFLTINPLGDFHNPLYKTDTLYIQYLLPKFTLSREDVVKYGQAYFGKATYYLYHQLSPIHTANE